MAASSLERLEVNSPKKLTRREFLRRAMLGTGAAAVGLAGYSGLIETNEIQVKKLRLSIERLAPAFNGFRIALISDFHFGPYTGAREIGAAVKKVNELQADVVALLGDFVSEPISGDPRAGAKKAEPCAQVLSGLRSRLGSFAVLGNHDYSTNPELVASALQAYGIRVLRNGNHVFEQEDARIWLLGVNDVSASAARVENALTNVPANEPKLLLVHEPDFADHACRFDIDAQFSGHSHGGQIRIPGVRPLWLPPFARKYYRGYYQVGRMQLYTNEGIGTIGLPFRFCAPPEVTLVTLQQSNA